MVSIPAPESDEHKRIKVLVAEKIERWFGSSIEEYPSSGHEVDIYGVTNQGVVIVVEVVWSSSKSHFVEDLNLVLESKADVKVVIASPDVLENQGLVRKYAKLAISQRRDGIQVAPKMFDGKMMLTDSDFLERDFKRSVTSLVRAVTTSPSASRVFERKYRRQIGESCRTIGVPHYDATVRVHLDRVFVPPSFEILVGGVMAPEGGQIPFKSLVDRLDRSVVLGDPGAGKSTLAQKIVLELSEQYEEATFAGRRRTPILVTLRDYSARKKERDISIVQFMENEAVTRFQMSRPPPEGALESLLNLGRCLVIFDGLDEIVDPGHRKRVVEDVELFCRMYPRVPVLVTSRVVGYEQAPLDPSRFVRFKILPFDSRQVERYALNWFSIDPDASRVESERKAKAFLRESEGVPDLRSNPLMLALMCNLYRGTGYIPHNRPEVYKKCSEMLLERWDASKGLRKIWSRLPDFEVRVLLGKLAYWIDSNEGLQEGVPEGKLIDATTRFLWPDLFEKEEQAEEAAMEFFEFCKGRAWIFTEVGVAGSGKGLYMFTHRTFLEYFTASQLVRKNNVPKEFVKAIRPRIEKGNADLVAQLAFQIINEQVEGASNEIFRVLLTKSTDSDTRSMAYPSFAMQCLQFVRAAEPTIRSLASLYVNTLVESPPEGSNITDIQTTLLSVPPNYLSTVVDGISNSLARYLRSKEKESRLRAIELALTLPNLSDAITAHGLTENEIGLGELLNKMKERFIKETEANLRAASKADISASLLCYHYGNVRLLEFVTDHGMNHLTQQQDLTYSNQRLYSVTSRLLANPDLPKSHSSFEDLARLMASGRTPCLSTEAADELTLQIPREGSLSEATRLTGNQLFGYWVLWAAIAERISFYEEELEKTHEPTREVEKRLNRMRASVKGFKSASSFMASTNSASLLFISGSTATRLKKSRPTRTLSGALSLDLPNDSLNFIRKWAGGSLSIVGGD